MRTHPSHAHPCDEEALERTARRRAGARLGLYIHAGAFIAVNLLLAVLSAASGRHWAVFPATGWAMGLAIHFAVVTVLTQGGYERLVQRERERLALERDPW